MDKNLKSRVYILGAGCSYHEEHGYPLAKQFVSELNSYLSKIAQSTDCRRIQNSVERTVALFNQCQYGSCHASTIDQLINLILTRRCDDQIAALKNNGSNEAVGLMYQAVRDAKIATAACFFEKEKSARQHQIEKYMNFIRRKILDESGISTLTIKRLQQSSARVLSFNYDRLFELAFFAGFGDRNLGAYDPYSGEVLNCGVSAFGEGSEIQKDRFCFLKLHGSIGLQSTEDGFGQNVFQIGNVTDWMEQKIDDELFFPEKHTAVPPMIVFPYEKDFIVSKRSNQLPFRDYINRVWAHADYVLQEASEVWIIGYSCDPSDWMHIANSLHRARKCTRIVIQNLPDECNRIAEVLKIDYQITIPIEKYTMPF